MRSRLLVVPVWLIVGVCAVLPLGWLVGQILLDPTTLSQVRFDSFHLRLLVRTIGFNGLAAVVAVGLAIPVALVLGRSRARLLWLALPVSLLLPSLAYTYGWKQFFRLLSVEFDPGGAADVLRCIWSLGTWLWPIPAGVVALSLRRLDLQVQEQALLDGVLWRVTFRQLAAPMLASLCVVMVLAVQEFAVYEPTGISVIATEVRMVFDTGAFSSDTNPITQTIGLAAEGIGLADQRTRAASAVAASMPLLALIGVLCTIALVAGRKLATDEPVEVGKEPAALRPGVGWKVSAWMVVVVAVFVPIASMVLSLKEPLNLVRLWDEFSPQLTGSLVIAGVAGAVCLLVSLGACDARLRALSVIALLAFLVGGQLIAIALIRIYNRPWLDWVYNGLPVIVMSHVARFGWLPLLAGGATWARGFRQVRELAATDGATRAQATIHVVWPIAWPTLLSAGLLVVALALTEVPATVLLSPQRPQPIIPMLMTWVHMLRYDAMIQASLALCAMVSVLALIAVTLLKFGRRAMKLE